ncbi:MAG: ATP-grasp domain-containing protein [Gemmatimonadetes bacterium]|nr:ATP-grasp domain-containing protein [Gemmatimonadota bacterium]
MPDVTFVAPFFADTTLRFIEALAGLDGVRSSVISQDPSDRIPKPLRSRLAEHVRIADGLDPGEIAKAVIELRRRGQKVEQLLGTFEELQVPLGSVRDRLGIPGMDAATAENFRDKSRMKDILRAHGLPCARHALVRDPVAAGVFAGEVGYPLIAKPPAGSGSRGTHRLSSGVELSRFLTEMPPSDERPILLEEFVVGDEHSFDSMTLDGRLVWASINHYHPSPLEVVREPWIQWCVLLPRHADDPAYARIREAAGPALRALGMDRGLSHMEWFRRPDGSVAISEVAARPPGARFMNLISWAHGIDLFDGWARAMVFGRFEPPPRRYAAGAAYLRAQGPGASTIAGIRGLEEVAEELGPLVVESRLPRPGQPISGTYEGDGYIIVRHPDTEVVKDALWTIVTRLRVEAG